MIIYTEGRAEVCKFKLRAGLKYENLHPEFGGSMRVEYGLFDIQEFGCFFYLNKAFLKKNILAQLVMFAYVFTAMSIVLH